MVELLKKRGKISRNKHGSESYCFSDKTMNTATINTRIIALIMSAGLMTILNPLPLFANNNSSQLPNPGLTPLNKLYFIDQWSESVQQFFTLGPEAKIKLQLSLIAERIAEMKVIVENKGEEAPEVVSIRNSIQQKLDLISTIISKEQQKGKDTGNLQLIAQTGLEDTKRTLSSVLGENNQQLQDEILDNFNSVDGVTIDLEEQPSEGEQNGLSENPEQDEQKQDKNSLEAQKQDSVNSVKPQSVVSNPTITTSGGESTVTPTPSPTPTPTPIPSVYISWTDSDQKNCSLYLVKNGSEVLITSDDYGICPGQPDFVQSGDNYGVVWRENRAGTETTQIYFKRIDLNGQTVTGDIKLTQERQGRGLPSIAWTGTEYGLAWQDLRDEPAAGGGNAEIYFVRLDNNGNKLGNEMRISNCSSHCGGAELSWNSSGYYDLSWVENINGALTPHSAKLDSSGNIIQ